MTAINASLPLVDLTDFSGKKVLFMAGGTGGHVIPGLTVASLMIQHGANVEWLGTKKGIESRLVPEKDINIHYIKVNGLRGKGLLSLLVAPVMLVKAIAESIKVMKQIQPDCVVGMGGFASGPGGVAAYLLGKPVVVHEQNAIAGTTNRLLAKIATRVLQAFDGAFASAKKVITTGNPVRDSIAQITNIEADLPNGIRVLILGGSLGAKPLNDIMPEAFSELAAADVNVHIWHQCGKAHLDSVTELYRSEKLEARVDAFIDSMDEAYAWADVIVCRAGALTVAEVACAGKCAIFVPLPHAIDNHQYYNALSLVKENAGFMLEQNKMTVATVKSQLFKLLEDKQLINQTGNNARALAQVNAAQTIAQHCLEAIRVSTN